MDNTDKDYQVIEEEQNSYNVLMSQKNTKDLELDMYNRNEIIEHSDMIDNMSKENLIRLNYLLKNYERLHIRAVNLENFIYIDGDNNISQVILNEKGEIIISSPIDAFDTSYGTEEKNDYQENEKERATGNELHQEKQKKLTHFKNNGYADLTLFIVVIAFLIVIGILYILFWEI